MTRCYPRPETSGKSGEGNRGRERFFPPATTELGIGRRMVGDIAVDAVRPDPRQPPAVYRSSYWAGGSAMGTSLSGSRRMLSKPSTRVTQVES